MLSVISPSVPVLMTRASYCSPQAMSQPPGVGGVVDGGEGGGAGGVFDGVE
jgi:hypothetical protein